MSPLLLSFYGCELSELDTFEAHYENIPSLITRVKKDIEKLCHNGNYSKVDTLRHLLADLYLKNPKGSRSRNLESAIRILEKLIDSSELSIEARVDVLNKIAIAYLGRSKGEPRENLDHAIKYLKTIVDIYHVDSIGDEKFIASILATLGHLLSHCEHGDFSENIEASIAYQKTALKYLEHTRDTEMIASLHDHIADAYRVRPTGDRESNIQKSIEHCNIALKLFDNQSIDWAMAKIRIGQAYWMYYVGDRADNVEQAIAHCEEALDILTQSDNPSSWAQAHIVLGNSYCQHLGHNSNENIWKGIKHFRLALRVVTEKSNPVQWANICTSLAGIGYGALGGEHVLTARQFCRRALRGHSQNVYPNRWAVDMRNLAFIYRNLETGDLTKNLRKAIQYCHNALSVFTKDDYPFEWARTNLELAVVNMELCRRDQTHSFDNSLRYYELALTVFSLEQFPHYYESINTLIADFAFQAERWEDASAHYHESLKAGASIFSTSYTDDGSHHILNLTTESYDRAAYSWAKSGQFEEALRSIESGRARLLAKALSIRSIGYSGIEAKPRKSLQQTLQNIHALEAEYRLKVSESKRRTDATILKELREANMALRDLLLDLGMNKSVFHKSLLEVSELLQIIQPMEVVIIPVLTNQGGCIFVIPGEIEELTEENIVWLSKDTVNQISSLLLGANDFQGWQSAYTQFRHGHISKAQWFETFDYITMQLWEFFVSRFYDKLRNLSIRHLIFVPQGYLARLPIMCAWHEKDGTRTYLVDEFSITYSPSISTLIALSGGGLRSSYQAPPLVMGVSEYSHHNDLPRAITEAKSVSRTLRVEPILNSEVTRENLIQRSRSSMYIHLACHAEYAWDQGIYDSALYLGDNEIFSYSDIIAFLDLSDTRLVVLSACESAITEHEALPNEFLGLHTAFLQAGASAAIGSLWMVEDYCADIIMQKFYELIVRKGVAPHVALRDAQLWLRNISTRDVGSYYYSFLRTSAEQDAARNAFREISLQYGPDERPFSHPFYWSAFTYNGLHLTKSSGGL